MSVGRDSDGWLPDRVSQTGRITCFPPHKPSYESIPPSVLLNDSHTRSLVAASSSAMVHSAVHFAALPAAGCSVGRRLGAPPPPNVQPLDPPPPSLRLIRARRTVTQRPRGAPFTPQGRRRACPSGVLDLGGLLRVRAPLRAVKHWPPSDMSVLLIARAVTTVRLTVCCRL